MSDLFHDDIPENFIARVFEVIGAASQHEFQILTKRAERLSTMLRGKTIPGNAWLGVSVESADYRWRIAHLREVSAAVRFLSIEPLIASAGALDLNGIGWVIVGGESGPGARQMNEAWVREVRDQCQRAQVPFFFKQWGGVQKHRTGRLLDGQTWDAMPAQFTN
jgi:protein gp37